jgi:pyrrolysine biosynthesis protein PylC
MTFKALAIGGGLQGVEVIYLGTKAGWEMTLCDRRPNPPAKGLCSNFVKADVGTLSPASLAKLCEPFDLIIPALEDNKVLQLLTQSRLEGLLPPLAFDMEAYKISSSKKKSKTLFSRLGLPMAQPWHLGDSGAFVVKPSGLSGSRGVRFFDSSAALEKAYPTVSSRRKLVIEQKLEGPSYSVEVTAVGGKKVKSWQVTLLEMDQVSDCCRVVAPSGLSRERELEFSSMAETLAAELKLTGLMDLEAIDHHGEFTLLEIDARFPSQTPITVYWSTGVNLLYELARIFVEVPGKPPKPLACPRKVVYEHVLAKNFEMSYHGEHLMINMGPLTWKQDFMGAKEALIAGKPKSGHFAATLIRLEE